MPAFEPRALPLTLCLLALASGCAGARMPDPRAAAERWNEAAQRGDADAMYAMLSEEAQRTYGKKGTAALVKDSKKEIADSAEAVANERASVRAVAMLRFADGEIAELELSDGRFRVSAAGTLPTGARTPTEALAELRRALARRSYSGLMRVLSEETKSSLENDMSSLVDGLEEPETLDVKVTGDRAVVTVPGGHAVRLKREAGVWRVEDFD